MRMSRGQNQKYPRNVLTLQEKLKVIEDLENHMPYVEIAGKYKISKGQVSKIKREKEEIKGRATVQNPNMCKKGSVRYPIIEQEIKAFLLWMREQRLPLSSDIIRVHAKRCAAANGITLFTAQNGWFEKFLRLNQVQRSVRLFGAAGDVCRAHYDKDMNKLRKLVQLYDLQNVYNVDETGLLYCVIPSRTYLLTTENRNNMRGTRLMRSKSRVTLMVCTNATGTHKLPLDFVGK